MFHQIPDEMKRYNQWIVWKYEETTGGKPTKIPYCPQNPSRMASVTEPETWTDFNTACQIFSQGGFSGIGFVLTENDPFTFIDLDNPFEKDKQGNAKYSNAEEILQRQMKIHNAFDSYSERSPSGNSLHIICKGAVPSGRRRDAVELYSTARYMTMTGEVYNSAPIQPRQEYISLLWAEMGGTAQMLQMYQNDSEEVFTDDQILMKAADASNGEKFKKLYMGEWSDYYTSQSEADFALINIVSFYTQNRNQIKRIFRGSALGARAKAKREDYVSYMINKSFDRLLPNVDLSGLKLQMQIAIDKKEIKAKIQPKSPSKPNPYTFPTGLVGEIAEFIYSQSIYPVKEISLIAALALMSGICGKGYNVSGTGLNNYFVLLAKTGRGKEAMAKGIDKILNEVKKLQPNASDFLGPAEFASPQALVKHLNQKPCFMSIFTEFAMFLKQLTAINANSNFSGLRRMFLNLYNKSGNGQLLGGIVYSDRDKNVHSLNAPSFSFLGECTPEKYYRLLDEDLISEGLLPRFTTFEFLGEREISNKTHNDVKPNLDMVQRLAGIVSGCLLLQDNRQIIKVAFNKEAQEYFDYFNDVICTSKVNESDNTGVSAELWTRSHVKAMKLAALVAVGVQQHFPTITGEMAKWAIDIITYDNENIVSKFESGEISTNNGDIQQVREAKRLCMEYISTPYESLTNYKVIPKSMHQMRIIPYRYLSQKLAPLAAFRADKIGATNALKKAIGSLVDSGELQEIPRGQAEREFGSNQRCFAIRG